MPGQCRQHVSLGNSDLPVHAKHPIILPKKTCGYSLNLLTSTPNEPTAFRTLTTTTEEKLGTTKGSDVEFARVRVKTVTIHKGGRQNKIYGYDILLWRQSSKK